MATTPKGADDGDSHRRREKDFSPEYLAEIECCWLVMTRRYLEERGEDVAHFANVVERRLCGEIDIARLITENEYALEACEEHGLPYCLVDDAYDVEERVAEILTAQTPANVLY